MDTGVEELDAVCEGQKAVEDHQGVGYQPQCVAHSSRVCDHYCRYCMYIYIHAYIVHNHHQMRGGWRRGYGGRGVSISEEGKRRVCHVK